MQQIKHKAIAVIVEKNFFPSILDAAKVYAKGYATTITIYLFFLKLACIVSYSHAQRAMRWLILKREDRWIESPKKPEFREASEEEIEKQTYLPQYNYKKKEKEIPRKK